MAPTITRLVLSLALIVAAPVFYTILYIGYMEVSGRYDDEVALLFADVIVGFGFAVGWIMIWLFEVRWNMLRVLLTGGVLITSVILSVIIGLLLAMMIDQEALGILFGGMLFAVFWLLGTGLAWMELPAERRRRLASIGMSEVLCPTCGYNLRGLKVTTCPECGASFTVDTLFAAQLEQRKQLGSA